MQEKILFKVEPFIEVNNNGKYYLVFQIAINEGKINNRWIVGSKFYDSKAILYLEGKSSFREFGNLRKEELKGKKLLKFLNEKHVHWEDEYHNLRLLELRYNSVN